MKIIISCGKCFVLIIACIILILDYKPVMKKDCLLEFVVELFGYCYVIFMMIVMIVIEIINL